MTITRNDIGSIFSLKESGELIIIDDISDEYVHYRNEMGETFASTNYKIDGIIVSDPQRISLFRDNMSLGAALFNAEASALRKILVGSKHDPEVREANSVLETIQSQKAALRSKINSYCKANHLSNSSLDSKIQNAEKSMKSSQNLSFPYHSHER